VRPPSSETLNAFRQAGDPEADRRISEIVAGDVRTTMKDLFSSARLEDSSVSAELSRFPYEPPDELVAEGQQVFLDHGPEILWLLGCYALPAAYAAKNGVEVLAQTGFLGAETNRRLIETAFMVVDVMTDGALGRDAVGTQTVDRVRIMHAAIRRLILERDDPRWDLAERGLPLNQEDMAGTLMTFSTLTIEGLAKLGIRLSRHEREAYISAWAYIGHRMGVDPALVPATYRDAKRLTKAIQDRQIDPSETSRTLTAALIPILEDKSLPGIPTATMRMCLPRPVWKGLGVRGNLIMDIFMRTVAYIIGWIDRLFLRFKRRSGLFRAFSMGLIDHLLTSDRDVGRSQYELPESLNWWRTETAQPATPTARLLERGAVRIGKGKKEPDYG